VDCERCGNAEAKTTEVTVLVDYGWGNGTGREDVSMDLCDACKADADNLEVITNFCAFLDS
jgi:hypothetical protein